MRYLTIVHDVDGLPRAHGLANTEANSKAEAERQWARRVRIRTEEGTLDRSEQRGETTTQTVDE